MSVHPDQPDYSVPALGPISKESRLSWHSRLSNHGIPYTEAMRRAGIGFVTEDTKRLREPDWRKVTGDFREGKFFPRGCRGHISAIQVYCRNTILAADTITVYISPMPGMGPTYTATIAVIGGSLAAWRPAVFNRMWNYDSLFIFVTTENDLAEWGYDDGAPYDYYVWEPFTYLWRPLNYRLWIRVNFTGETAGDVPVSGTLNVVPLPNVMGVIETAEIELEPAETEDVFTINGSGVLTYLVLWITTLTPASVLTTDMQLRWVVDGVAQEELSVGDYIAFVATLANTPTDFLFTEIDTAIDTVSERSVFHHRIKIPFRHQLILRARNSAAANSWWVTATYWAERLG